MEFNKTKQGNRVRREKVKMEVEPAQDGYCKRRKVAENSTGNLYLTKPAIKHIKQTVNQTIERVENEAEQAEVVREVEDVRTFYVSRICNKVKVPYDSIDTLNGNSLLDHTVIYTYIYTFNY